MEKAQLIYQGKTHELPVIEGTENEKGIDISKLRQETGLITLDVGYQNTGACASAITFIDGDRGILRYRGIPIEELAEKASFTEVAYLLIYGDLPNREQQQLFSQRLTQNSMIHEEMLRFFDGFPPTAHPMAILATMVNSMSVYYTDYFTEDFKAETFDPMAASLISRIRTIAAYSYKHSIGHPHVYPKPDLKYASNFLYMMFDSPVSPYIPDPDIEKALSTLLILHADHEQNCSTSAVRLVGSARVNLYAAISAGISALWGPLHGGANQAVIEMLQEIYNSGGDVAPFIARAKDKNDEFRLMGFGHRVYKSYDPRAKIMEEIVHRLLSKLQLNDPLLDIAKRLEEIALKDSYFVDHKLYPNVDFYSGIIMRAIGIPLDMFTVMFAIGRLPGWIAQWKEMRINKEPIGRPRQIYVGHPLRDFKTVEQR